MKELGNKMDGRSENNWTMDSAECEQFKWKQNTKRKEYVVYYTITRRYMLEANQLHS